MSYGKIVNATGTKIALLQFADQDGFLRQSSASPCGVSIHELVHLDAEWDDAQRGYKLRTPSNFLHLNPPSHRTRLLCVQATVSCLRKAPPQTGRRDKDIRVDPVRHRGDNLVDPTF